MPIANPDPEEQPKVESSLGAAHVILSERFPSAVHARSAWEWAGGRVELVPCAGTPTQVWAQLWQSSMGGEAGAASPAALVREALFEEPEDEVLLKLAQQLLRGVDPELWERVKCALPGVLHALAEDDSHALCVWLAPFEGVAPEVLCLAFCVELDRRLREPSRARAIETTEMALTDGPESDSAAVGGRVLVTLRNAAAAQWHMASRVSDLLEPYRFEIDTIASTHADLFTRDPIEHGWVRLDVEALERGLDSIGSWVAAFARETGSLRLLIFEELVRSAALRVAMRGAAAPWPELVSPLESLRDALRSTGVSR